MFKHIRRDPFLILAICLVLPVFAMSFASCSKGRQQRLEILAASTQRGIATITPRDGVECYVLDGGGPSTPRVMSCVAIPAPTQDECL